MSTRSVSTADLSPRTARIAQIVCLVLIAGGVALLVAALVWMWPGMVHPCARLTTCQQYQLDSASAQFLSRHDISLSAYATGLAFLLILTTLVWYALAALILWKRPGDRGAIVAAFFLALFPQLPLGTITNWDAGADASIGLVALIIFGLLFPDGHFKPRWTRWWALGVFVMLVAISFTPGSSSGNGNFLWVVPVLVLPAAVVGTQIYRYRKLSTWSERQRSKWAFFGIISGILGIILVFVTGTITQPSTTAGMGGGDLSGLWVSAGIVIFPLAIPVSITIALLRSNLWDIDHIISRALAYAVLSAVIVGAYIGGVVGLQSLFALFAHSGSPAAIALSTLAIVALFGPMLRRIQRIVDRRFYRSRYDAARTVATFGERLRDQVDLGQLSSGLTAVVHEALHPEHVSLWLREMREG